MSGRPVLIQTLWRTGGTYLAFRLRETNPLAMYVEPLHEDYSRHPRARWEAWARAGMVRGLGHPDKGLHYLMDYPQDAGGLVPGHQASFAWAPFVLRPGDAAPALSAYLRGLAAADPARRPLFKFCRATLRGAWIEALFDAPTLYVLRDPADMVAAHLARGGGDYFFSGFLRIVLLNAESPVLAPAAALLTARAPALRALDAAALADPALCHRIGMADRVALALHLWLLSLAAHARPGALVVDSADFPEPAVWKRIGAHLGLPVDLSDAEPLPSRGGIEAGFDDPAWRDAARAALGPATALPEGAHRYAGLTRGLLA